MHQTIALGSGQRSEKTQSAIRLLSIISANKTLSLPGLSSDLNHSWNISWQYPQRYIFRITWRSPKAYLLRFSSTGQIDPPPQSCWPSDGRAPGRGFSRWQDVPSVISCSWMNRLTTWKKVYSNPVSVSRKADWLRNQLNLKIKVTK